MVIAEQKGPGPSRTLALSTVTTKYGVGIGDEVGVVEVGVAVPVSSAETRVFSVATSVARRFTSVVIALFCGGDWLPVVFSVCSCHRDKVKAVCRTSTMARMEVKAFTLRCPLGGHRRTGATTAIL